MGKNTIVVKTFEEFQDDNKKYYPIVLQAITQIASLITKGSKQAGDWLIEGGVDYDIYPESGEKEAYKENQVSFINQKEGTDIFIDWNIFVKQTHHDPGDGYITPPSTEHETNVTIDSVLYYTENGTNEYQIVVDEQMSNACEKLLDAIANNK